MKISSGSIKGGQGMKLNDVMICSYFTAGTGYQKEAARFVQSLKALQITNFHVSKISSLGNWFANTHHKAKFILDMFSAYPDHAIVWIDCDAVIHSYPVLFEQIDADFAAHFRNWMYGKDELLSGTLFFRNNARIRLILKEWIEVNRNNPHKWDQKNLQRVISRHDHAIRIYRLPIEYCLIYDDTKSHLVKPVITHFQASRLYKKKLK